MVAAVRVASLASSSASNATSSMSTVPSVPRSSSLVSPTAYLVEYVPFSVAVMMSDHESRMDELSSITVSASIVMYG